MPVTPIQPLVSNRPKTKEEIKNEVKKDWPHAEGLLALIDADPELEPEKNNRQLSQSVVADWDNARFIPYSSTRNGRYHVAKFFNRDWMLVSPNQPQFRPAIDALLLLTEEIRQMRFRQLGLLLNDLTRLSKPFWDEVGKNPAGEKGGFWEPLSWSFREFSRFHRSLEVAGMVTVNYPQADEDKVLYFGRVFLENFDLLILKRTQFIIGFVERVRLITGNLSLSILLSNKEINQPTASNEAEEKPEITKPDYKFNDMPLPEVEQFFRPLVEKKSKNGKPFLTEGEFSQFIKEAFEVGVSAQKLTLNFCTGERTSVMGLFYGFYQTCTNNFQFERTRHCKEKYVRLLTDHFTNYQYSTVFANFNTDKRL